MLMTIFSSPVLLALMLSGITYALIQLYLRFSQKGNSNQNTQMAHVAAVNPISTLPHNRPGYNPVHIPATLPALQLELEELPEEADNWELVEDDSSILLKEAESVTEQISSIIANIASDPPNPAEVYTKIKALVSQYKIFKDTDFFDAINRFIVVAVERELKLSFTEAELLELWD